MSDGLWTEVKMTSLRLGVPVQVFVSGWLAHAVEMGTVAGHGSDVQGGAAGEKRGSAARRRVAKAGVRTDAVSTAVVGGVGKVTVSEHVIEGRPETERTREALRGAIAHVQDGGRVGGAGTAVDRGGAAVVDDAGVGGGDAAVAPPPVRELTVVDDVDLF